MSVLIYGLGVFLLALLLHIIIWKIRVPKKQADALLLIFFSTLAVVFSVCSSIINLTAAEYMHIVLFFTSLVLAYIITYSAVSVDSPSLLIAIKINNAKPEGLRKEDLENSLTDELLVKPRIKDLLVENMIRFDKGQYELTKKGSLILGVVIFYQKILGCKKGG